MGRLILITGGARSGKSTFAESTAKSLGENVLYVATAIPVDGEMRARIKRHREQRPANWVTIEAHRDLHAFIKPEVYGKCAVLIDCITVMITNILFDENVNWENAEDGDIADLESRVNIQIGNLLDLVKDMEIVFILVTNELGMGMVPEYYSGRVFRDIAGRVNQRLASAADEVYFCVSGIPLRIK